MPDFDTNQLPTIESKPDVQLMRKTALNIKVNIALVENLPVEQQQAWDKYYTKLLGEVKGGTNEGNCESPKCLPANAAALGGVGSASSAVVPEGLPANLLNLWEKSGRPVICLGPGQRTLDLNEFLRHHLSLTPVQVKYLRTWYVKNSRPNRLKRD